MKTLNKLKIDNCISCTVIHRHHTDPLLKDRDPVRYKLYLEDDIILCTPLQHSYLHKIYNNFGDDEYKAALSAVEDINKSCWNESVVLSLSSSSQERHF